MLCFRNFPVAKKIMDEGGGIKIFRRKLLCLRVPEAFLGENLCAVSQRVSASEKDYG